MSGGVCVLEGGEGGCKWIGEIRERGTRTGRR